MKNCSRCSIEKDIVDFPKKGNICKLCESIRRKIHKENNKERLFLKYRENYLKNKDKIIEKASIYYKENKDSIKEYKKAWHQENREEILLEQKAYRSENKEEISIKKKEWYSKNKEKVKKYQSDNRDSLTIKKKEHYHKNKDKYNELNRIYIKNKKANNPLYKLTCSIRSLISQSFKLKYTKKAKKTINILGCSFEEFKIYIESKFTIEMNWDNYAIYWQLDHITPISWAKNEEEVYLLNHYTNFQPLEWRENIKKGNKYDY